MEILASILESLNEMFSWAWYLFTHGGWAFFVILTLYILYEYYLHEIQAHYFGTIKWTLLNIKVDKNNIQSTLAVEQVFAQMHAIHTNFTFPEKYLEGKFNLWISLEIVSIGGKISYFVYTPVRYVNLIEAAFYARYPNAEITEVTDYMANLKHYDPNASWDLWGTEFKLLKDFSYPIRSYRDFEHPSAEEKIIDPNAGLIEAMAKIEPHELMAVQFCMTPIGDVDWIPHAETFAKELKQKFIKGSKGHDDDEDAGGNAILSGGERKILESIEFKASKPGWATKIRALYIAPKDRMDSTKRAGLIGNFRQLGNANTNGLKPDVSGTWTNYNYKFFKELEQPYVDFQVRKKKKKMLEGYAGRSMLVGQVPMIFNTEELATLFHFPLSPVAAAPVENVSVKRGSPPPDLPVL